MSADREQGATFCAYLFPENALADLIAAAEVMAQIKKHTGRTGPDVTI